MDDRQTDDSQTHDGRWRPTYPISSPLSLGSGELKKRGEPEGAKDYREIKRKIRAEMKMAKETWIQRQCQEVAACLRKNNNKKAYQLVKDLTTEKQDKSTNVQDTSGKCLTEEHEMLRPLQL